MNIDATEDIAEILRLVECMHQDYTERNFGDAEKWIRYISNAYSKFEEKYDDTAWHYMRWHNGL